MKCNNCGNVGKDNDSFCTICGSKLVKEKLQIKAEETKNNFYKNNNTNFNSQMNLLAIIGFIVSLLFSSVIGIIICCVALSKSKEFNSGKGVSIAGIIIGLIKIVVCIIAIVFVALFATKINSLNYDDYVDNYFQTYDSWNKYLEEQDDIIVSNYDYYNSICVDGYYAEKFEISDNTLYAIEKITNDITSSSNSKKLKVMDDIVYVYELTMDSCGKTNTFAIGINGNIYHINNVKGENKYNIELYGKEKYPTKLIYEDDNLYYYDINGNKHLLEREED